MNRLLVTVLFAASSIYVAMAVCQAGNAECNNVGAQGEAVCAAGATCNANLFIGPGDPPGCCTAAPPAPPPVVATTSTTLAPVGPVVPPVVPPVVNPPAPVVGGNSTTGTNTTGCVDLLNPLTGSSDCPAKSFLCSNPVYNEVMNQQCRKTCNRCNGANGNGTANGTSTNCVDRVNPNTGVSDCPARKGLCDNAAYFTLMTVQCPATCGRCNGNGTTNTNGTNNGVINTATTIIVGK